MIDYTAVRASPTRSVIFLPIDLARQDSRGKQIFAIRLAEIDRRGTSLGSFDG